MNRRNDPHFSVSRITGVGAASESGWTLTFEDGWSLHCPNVECDQPPKIGERASLYGKGFGHTVRGIVIEGRVYSYRTAAEEAALHKASVVTANNAMQADLDANVGARDARIAALPDEFRERMLAFHAKEHWRRDFETYELMVCEQAVMIARTLETPDRVVEVSKLPAAEQKVALPALDEGHSGNSFGAAMTLAKLYLEAPHFVPKMHGALCPLVGCEGYGCFAVRRKAGAA